jgi:hypothetical protein
MANLLLTNDKNAEALGAAYERQETAFCVPMYPRTFLPKLFPDRQSSKFTPSTLTGDPTILSWSRCQLFVAAETSLGLEPLIHHAHACLKRQWSVAMPSE